MKKIIYDQYGSVDVLHAVEVNKPVPGTQQILVKVKAVSINPIDWKILMGGVKLMSGKKFPKSVVVTSQEQLKAQVRVFKNLKQGMMYLV